MLTQQPYLKMPTGPKPWSLRSILFWLTLLAGPLAIIAAQPTFTATLDRDSVVVGETVVLTLKFEGGSPQGMPALPQVPGLQPAGQAATSINSTVVNGAMTSVFSYSVNLVPQHAGDFVIPPITAQVEGQNVQSLPIKLKVLQSDPAAAPEDSANKLAFLSLSLPKRDVFVGEVLVAEMRLYIRSDVRNISDVQIPPLRGDGFTASKFIEGGRFNRRVGAAQFTVIPLLTAMTPVKSGELALGPINGSVVAHVSAGGRRLDPFDSFFGPQTQPQQVPIAIEQQTVHVLPLPAENVPPGFNGAVGSYTMACTVGPTNVAVGDPITVKLSGKGNLDALAIPEQADWRDFKTYPPTSRIEPHDQLGVEGTKYFEQIVIPQSADLKELPALSFSYFDPAQKAYRTLRQPAVPLVVRPGGSAVAPTVAASRGSPEAPPPSQDIVPIKQRLGIVAQIAPPLLRQPWFLALQSVPVLAWLSALVWRRRIEQLANNPRLRRQRLVAHIIHEGLPQLRRLAAENKSDEFFGTVFHLLQEQLGERLNLPASAITEAIVDDYLRPRAVPEATLAELQELFQNCNLARYAPIKSSQELAAMIPKLETVLGSLRETDL